MYINKNNEYFSTLTLFSYTSYWFSYESEAGGVRKHEPRVFKLSITLFCSFLCFMYLFVCVCVCVCVCGPQRSENFLHLVFVHKIQGKHHDWPNNVIMVKGITCMTGKFSDPCGRKGRSV